MASAKATVVGLALLGWSLTACAPTAGGGEWPEWVTDSARKGLQGAGTFERVADFGANPGGLNMYRYVPPNAPQNAPLVVAMHACSQNAAAFRNAGWETFADEYGFYVIYPEQTAINNALGCFNWAGEFGNGANIPRGDGENQSIINMIRHMQAEVSIDASRIFATGHSGGGAQTMLMLATWPDVFAAGAPIAGIAYKCTLNFNEVNTCLNPGLPRPAATWGGYVRDAFPGYDGPYPRLSIWHGTQDATVAPANATEILKQWTDVHGIGLEPATTDTIDGHIRKRFNNNAGTPVIELWEVQGAGHGTFVDPDQGCGTAGAFFLDANVCSTGRIADWFGLTGEAPNPGDAEAPTVNLTAPVSGASVSGRVALQATATDDTGVTEVTFLVNGAPVGVDVDAPYQVEWAAGALPAGDYALRVEAVDAAGNLGVDDDTTVTLESDVVDDTAPTVDLTAPADGVEVSGMVQITAAATDDFGVARVEFRVDGDVIGQVLEAPYQLMWNADAVPLGARALSAHAFDAAGNEGVDADTTVTVVEGQGGPVVTLRSPIEGATVSGIIEIAVDTEPGGAALRQGVLFWETPDQGEQNIGIDYTAPFDFLVDVDQLPEGPRRFIVRVFDEANDVGAVSFMVNVVRGSGEVDAGVGAGGAGGSGEPDAPATRTAGRSYWGCSAAPGEPDGAPGLWLLILGLGVLTRRRRERK